MSRSSSTVVEPMLEDYAALEYILLGDLRDLLEEPPGQETRRWLVAVLDALLQTLPRELELQEQGGYLAEVLEQYPSWSNQVDELHEAKRELFANLRQLREQVAAHTSFTRLAEEVRGNLRDWMIRLVAHHRHERRMVQTAFTLEVGVGD